MADHLIVTNCKSNMDKRIKTFDGDLSKIRTGRASVSVLDGVRVDYYGTLMPLNQVATLTSPDARMIVVSPFEKALIQAIEKAIMIADIGLQPTNDGNVVRLPIPPLTEDRRKDLAKQVKKLGEDAKVAIRLVRRDAMEEIKKSEKDKSITEDEKKKLEADTQKITDGFVKLVDDKIVAKEKEIMKI